jgi:hypothetical protein
MQQQQQIEQLKQALLRSQQQLLVQQQNQQPSANLKSVLAQQLQKKQLAVQIQQLQQLQEQQRQQQQVQEMQAAAAAAAHKEGMMSSLALCNGHKTQEVRNFVPVPYILHLTESCPISIS